MNESIPTERYAIREDEPNSWTVLDTHTPPARENRIIYRVSEAKAKKIADHLNMLFEENRKVER